MSAASRFASGSVPLGRGSGVVTIVEQSAFCLCAHEGDIHEGGAEGVFTQDTRVLSRLQLRVDGHRLEALSVAQDAEDEATFVLRTPPRHGSADSRLMVVRRRSVADGLDETLELRNFGSDHAHVQVTLDVDTDLADVFAVKQGRAETVDVQADVDGDTLHLTRGGDGGDGTDDGGHDDGNGGGQRDGGDGVREVVVRAEGATIDGRRARWSVDLDPDGSWTTRITVRPAHGRRTSARLLERRRETWRHRTPTLQTDLRPLQAAYEQSLKDLDALRLFGRDPDGLPVIAAGAPWFMTLFGRDSILTSYMTLLVDHDLALGVLQTLARHQGTRVDPQTEEQPGRILHEVRHGGSSIYYGTADATPLFVVLLGECLRWGLPWERLEPLLPNADRALQWVEEFGDRDGDGYVEYKRMTPQGSPNQGWKDSADAIVFADGKQAEPPIALVEVQGYVYAAYRARAALARRAGDADRAASCDRRAEELRERFDRDFWMPERGYYALALDRDKRHVDALASNIGHTLWTGIALPERARAVADLLTSPELFSGWGVRTLASSMAAYNPMSYQRGSVWPHDTAICVAGLARNGFTAEAARIGVALLEAGQDQGGRLPELFTGLARDDVARPVAYPTSCSPQAWASAAPLLVLRSLLRLEPDAPAGQVAVDPIPLDGVDELVLDGVPVGTDHVRVTGSLSADQGS